VKKQVSDLSNKTKVSIQPVFVSKNIGVSPRQKELNPPLINNQRVVYQFECDLCDASYVGYTKRHLHERIEEHKNNQSSIYKHYKNNHNTTPGDLLSNVSIVKRSRC